MSSIALMWGYYVCPVAFISIYCFFNGMQKEKNTQIQHGDCFGIIFGTMPEIQYHDQAVPPGTVCHAIAS